MNLREMIRRKVLGILGIAKVSSNPDDDRLTFINDSERLMRTRIREYNIWYDGDGDELLNFYTGQTVFDYNYEPYYSRNKKNYFWSISSTENNIKRTHSGQARNVVDTLVAIMRFPHISAGPRNNSGKNNVVNENLQAILKDSKLKEVYKQEQMPMTLVEGWGCYRIDWDLDVSDYPFATYYRADNVDFVYKNGRVIGVIFKDYYIGKKEQKYLLTETRRLKYDAEKHERCLVIEKELFRMDTRGDFVTKVEFEEVENLKKTIDYVEIGPFNSLFAVPSVFFGNTSKIGGPGRSIFQGKIDLLDDLDQCLSQSANTVRRSTTREYFNTDFLERDEETGMPKQPKVFDRAYTMYTGGKNSNGESTGDPVQVTQPAVNFQQYSDQAISILMQIINGVMSPATLGIDISKKDNAEAQREKEKVTIFTRNSILETEGEILKDLCSQLLCAYEFMHKGTITCHEYNISIKFSDFADDSYEVKLEKLGAAFDAENISEEMYMSKLYGNSLTDQEYERELAWLKEHHTKPRDEGMLGMMGANTPQDGNEMMMDENGEQNFL